MVIKRFFPILVLNFFNVNAAYTQLSLPPNMIFVQGGTLTIGCTNEQKNCENDECAAHDVNISDFYIGEHEVTQEQWMAVMDNNNPAMCVSCADSPGACPVEQISWYQAAVFCNRLSELRGLTPCYYSNPGYTLVFGKIVNNWPVDPVNTGPIYWKLDANGFRLPTEAEWEYAARGGNVAITQTRYSGGDNPDNVAWYYNNSCDPPYSSPIAGCINRTVGTRPVKTKSPNVLGLYDMSGNVWEYCYDYYGPCNLGQICNPTGPLTGANRVARGGAITVQPNYLRIANRSDNGIGVNPSVGTQKIIGLRLARTQ